MNSLETLEKHELYSVAALARGDTLYAGGDAGHNGISFGPPPGGTQLRVKEYRNGSDNTIYCADPNQIDEVQPRGFGGNDRINTGRVISREEPGFGIDAMHYTNCWL